MEWIKITQKTPEEYQDCWVCIEKNVIDGFWKEKAPFYDEQGNLNHERGFVIDEETAYCLRASEVSHWMPYFTPQPPKR